MSSQNFSFWLLNFCFFLSMEEQINAIAPAEYTIEPASLESYQNPPAENEEFLSEIVGDLSDYGEVENVRTQTNLIVGAYLAGDSLEQLPAAGSPEEEALDPSGQSVYIYAETVDTYNKLNNASETLAEDEVLLTSNLLDTDEMSTIDINGRTYETKIVSSDALPANSGVESLYLGVSSQEQLNTIQEEYQTYSPNTGEYTETSYNMAVYFDVAGDETAISNRLDELANDHNLNVETMEETRNSAYSLYGGLLFIGTVVSVVLIIGTVLMLHFKQISEGYEDRNKYNIMQKVGLPDSLIRKTIRSQIIWVFLLPILVAIVHNIFASNIMYSMIGLLGLSDPTIFITSYFGVIVVFAFTYLAFYWLTSKTYYNIINGD